MAKAELHFNCGCGFQTMEPVLAHVHVDETGHTMEIHGWARPDGEVNTDAKRK